MKSSSTLPAYLDLANYQQGAIPFTLPAVLVANVAAALQAYPERYGQLQQRFKTLLQLPFMHYQVSTRQYPMLVTLKLPKTLANLQSDLMLNGYYVHADSQYLRQRDFIQLSVIQPDFEIAINHLHKILNYYKQIVEA